MRCFRDLNGSQSGDSGTRFTQVLWHCKGDLRGVNQQVEDAS